MRQWLKDERRTQEWLAKELRVRQTSVSRWLRDSKTTTPTLESAIAIRRLTGVSLESWLEPVDQSTTRRARAA